jgi:hypothetical protein
MLKDFIYVYLTDLCRVMLDHDYKHYVNTEPGYGEAILKAYQKAFSTPKDGKITQDLIKNIHQTAMSFGSRNNQDQYKDKLTNFTICFSENRDYKKEKHIHPYYNASPEGLKEYLCYWKKQKGLNQALRFIKKDADKLRSTNHIFLVSPYGLHFTKYIPENNENIQTKDMTFKDGFNLICEMLDDCTFNCYMEPMLLIKKNTIKETTKQLMEDVINQYNEGMKNALSSDEKLKEAVTFLQRVTQIHPFIDGNIRTCYILLNKLLRDFDLPLTVLINPNRLDCCSLSEVISMVKQGQEHYQQLLKHEKGSITLKFPNEMKLLQTITLNPQELFDIESQSLIKAFINCLIHKTPEIENSNITSQHFLKDEKSISPSLVLFVRNRLLFLKNHENEYINKNKEEMEITFSKTGVVSKIL